MVTLLVQTEVTKITGGIARFALLVFLIVANFKLLAKITRFFNKHNNNYFCYAI